MKNDILRLLNKDKNQDVFFTTMLDLYAIHADFPGTSEADKLRNSPYDRVKMLEKYFAEDIDDPIGRLSRFIPHIQLHEFEAMLFCRPKAFSSFFIDRPKQIEQLEKIADKFKSPELIDDGQHSAPSKRIIGVFPDYKGAKSVAGPQIAEEIGLHTVRDRCPHFDAWLKRLEALASSDPD